MAVAPPTEGRVTELINLLQQIAHRPAAVPGDERRLAALLLAAGDRAAAETDSALAATWQTSAPVVRQQVLRDALSGHKLGVSATTALLASVHSGDHISANAAIAVFGSQEPPGLAPADWAVVAKNAVAQREQALPDVESGVLVANHGPPQTFATVALLAFRDGPEDAEDRLAAVTGLGRFDDPRVMQWLELFAATGAFGLEAICGAAAWAARHTKRSADESDAVRRVLWTAARGGEQPADFGVDEWQRWGAIDVLSHMDGFASLLMVAAAYTAGGADLQAWYPPALAQRVMDVCEDRKVAALGADAVVKWVGERSGASVAMPAIGSLEERSNSRCPRVSRRAMVLLEQDGGRREAYEQAAATRAAVEQALVQRGQLMGSFLTQPDTPAAELPQHWASTAELLHPTARAQLLASETSWLATC